MPSPSPGKCRGSVVRQLSLQNQVPPQQGVSRGLKKQFSEDDGRGLEPVGVTGQGWPQSDRPVPILRIGSGEGKIGSSRVTGTRPKPVKVAWADRKTDSPESPAGVEVIATKCQGQPRPTSVKAQRLRSPLLGNKDTLVYTRLQLEERLRNAWSERAKIKPNINIFLAQGSDTTRSDNNESASERSSVQDSASALSDPAAPLDKKRKSMQVRAFFHDFCPPEFQEGFIPPSEASPEEKNPCEQKEEEANSPRSEDKTEGAGRHLQELNKIEIRMTKAERGKEVEGSENKDPAGVKRPPEKDEEDSEEATPSVVVTAQDRRANFRRSSAMHKPITESFSLGEKEDVDKGSSKPPQKKAPLVRAFSAPSQSNDSSDPNRAANSQKKVKIIPQKRLQPTVSFDIPSSSAEDIAAMRERIKSAPVRRRLKSAAARRKNKEKDSSDEEIEGKVAPTAAAKKTTRRTRTKNGGEIVTMVSLVSPAASDTEDSVINLPLDPPWAGEEKEEKTTPTQGGSSSGGGAAAEEAKNTAVATPFVIQKFVSLRKTAKSVTFQPHPVLNRGYSASFPSRRAPAGTPIIIPTPVVSNRALTPAQLLERDKRPSIFSTAVPTSDGRGVKRRLLRSTSESPKEEDSLEVEEKPPDADGDAVSETSEVDGGGEDKPELKCPKEKECWNLYQKMVAKGVSVSFDTVLRGMLTPTEYRLRKNRLLSNC